VAVVGEARGNVANRAHLLRGAELQPLLSTATLVEGAFWAGGRLYLIADVDSEYQGLVEVDPAEPERIARWLIREEHDVDVAVPAPDGRHALVAINRGPYDELRVLDLESGESRSLDLEPGLVTADNVVSAGENVAWAGERLLVAWESSSRPADIVEPETRTRWTMAGGDGAPELPAPIEVEIESFDGVTVPALHHRVDGTPRPTVVYFHGGPESQLRASFTPQVAMWLGAGFDVLAPNVRGSTGYGRRYLSLDDRGLRWDAVRDGCVVGRWAKEHGGATSLVAMGGSYGGFMTLAVLVEDPELWDLGVDIVGIADWHSFLRNTSGWRRSMRVAEYGEPDGPDGEFLAEFSPLRRADRIKARLLIIHGRNDPRVPVGEAEQIHQAVPGSELLILDDEGHGLTKHGNRSRAYGHAVDFVREGLRA
jgi:dipeptidyl aminopeptidase/acylaminoacyl peptidase